MKTIIKYSSTLLVCFSALLTACENTGQGTAGLSIRSISPLIGGPGSELLIDGTGFPADETDIEVAIDGIEFLVVDCHSGQILVEVPDNRALIGTKAVEVTVGGKTVKSPQEFTYFDSRMYIASFEPASARFGEEVTVTGEKLPTTIDGLSVSVNGVELSVVSSAADQIVVSVPQNDEMGTGPMVVRYNGQKSKSTADFTYIVSAIKISSIVPLNAYKGAEITISGEGFSSGVKVSVNGVEFGIVSVTATEIKAIVPDNAAIGIGPVVITDGTDTRVSTEQFTYEKPFPRTVSLFAGTPGVTGYQNGPGNQAIFNFNNNDEWDWRRSCVCVDANDNIYVGDIFNKCIRKITPDGEVSTLAGSPGVHGCVDGTGPEALIGNLYGFDCDAQGNVWFPDIDVRVLRKVTPKGVVTTVADVPFQPWYLAVDRASGDMYVTMSASGSGGIWKFANNSFTAIEAAMGINYAAVTVDKQGNLFATNNDNHCIEKFTKNGDGWTKTKVAGSTDGYADGSFAQAQFSVPCGLAINSIGDIIVAGNGTWNGGTHIDQSIRYLDMEGGRVITVGGRGAAGYANGIGSDALFFGPQDVAVDSRDNIYVFDKQNNAVRKISYQ